MLAVTSLSPTTDNTKHINSWKALGLNVISVNHPYDIKLMSGKYDITFIPTTSTTEKIFGKPYVRINALIDAGFTLDDQIMLINSDIYLDDSDFILSKIPKDRFTVVSRYDYDEDPNTAVMNPFGLDVFVLNKDMHVSKRNYCMGKPMWDYWLPMHMFKKGVPITHVISPFAYHKKHKLRWNSADWMRCGHWFRHEFNVMNHDWNEFYNMTYKIFMTNAIQL